MIKLRSKESEEERMQQNLLEEAIYGMRLLYWRGELLWEDIVTKNIYLVTEMHCIRFRSSRWCSTVGILRQTSTNWFHTGRTVQKYQGKSQVLMKKQSCTESDNQRRTKKPYLPTEEKIFMRFWWQWSSGKFSAITIRDYRHREDTGQGQRLGKKKN